MLVSLFPLVLVVAIVLPGFLGTRRIRLETDRRRRDV